MKGVVGLLTISLMTKTATVVSRRSRNRGVVMVVDSRRQQKCR